ncbi:(d)CMP kinase [Thorsellia kenyensis]|uniref:Cytidylate kinase n=1 Tax=Thorsellia kenyensis TaxID=1549888 RepID=A0ABV6CBP9_9GAMM
MNSEIKIITVDGPSGVGKGTLSQSLANHFGFHLLDSGAIYRVLALYLIQNDEQDALEDEIVQFAQAMDVCFGSKTQKVQVLLSKQDVSELIRAEHVGTLASKIAALPKVREQLLQKQIDFAKLPGLVADGRDMGTVVFPKAFAKLFIDASSEARALRRVNQLKERGLSFNYHTVLDDIIQRDIRDRTRTIAPLVPAEDALVIDTTSLRIDEVFKKALNFVEGKLG